MINSGGALADKFRQNCDVERRRKKEKEIEDLKVDKNSENENHNVLCLVFVLVCTVFASPSLFLLLSLTEIRVLRTRCDLPIYVNPGCGKGASYPQVGRSFGMPVNETNS